MKKEIYDIAIVGLGPAGASLARLIDKKYKVIALSKNNDKTSKCCGGLLSLDAQKVLASFDISLPNEILVSPQIFSVRTIDLYNNIEKYYQRFYLNMNRKAFDEFLISLIPSYISIETNSFCTKISKEDEIFNIIYKKKDKEYNIKSKIVIGADGANSLVRNTFYKNKKIDKYVSIQEWYKKKKTTSFYSCIFDKRITPSYAWTISKDDYFILGGAFKVKEAKVKFESLKEKLIKRGFEFGKFIKKEGTFVYNFKGINNICTGKNGTYLVGEASGMISPSSLEGISYALNSAKILASVINSNKNISRMYFLKTLSLRFKLMFKMFKKPFMYNSFFRKIVMKSGISSIKK